MHVQLSDLLAQITQLQRQFAMLTRLSNFRIFKNILLNKHKKIFYVSLKASVIYRKVF